MSAVTSKDVWLVLPDPLPTRVFVDCAIADGLRDRLEGRVAAVLVLPREQAATWSERLRPMRVIAGAELFPRAVPPRERVARRIDLVLDHRAGYYPLSVRHSLRNGFHGPRMRRGHPNLFLDTAQGERFPRSPAVDRMMARWLFSPRRHVSSKLVERMRHECSGVVVANVQSRVAVPFLIAGRRLRLPIVGYVASWDHTVGKGLVCPDLERYIVQNDFMRDDLVRFHGVPTDRVAITGWPQTDLYHERRARSTYEALVRSLALDPARPVVLVAGNTPTNAPYEQRLVDRFISWWRDSGASERFSLVFRPHPRDTAWRERFGAARATEGAAVQEPSYTDLEVLATLLQHVDCVVANAGTILLDAIVNDRPAVCVLFDEGVAAGKRHAELNVTGAHYRRLIESQALLTATSFDELVAKIERALADPRELEPARARAVAATVGEIDGRAAERVVSSIASGVAASLATRGVSLQDGRGRR